MLHMISWIIIIRVSKELRIWLMFGNENTEYIRHWEHKKKTHNSNDYVMNGFR